MPASLDLSTGVAREHLRARFAFAVLFVNLVYDAANVVLHFLRLWVIARIRSHDSHVLPLARALDGLVVCSGLAAFPLLIISAIVFLVWLHSAFRNLSLVGSGAADTTPRWAVGGFFVPILNVYHPFRVVKEIRLRSGDRNAIANSRDGDPAPWSIRVWWISYFLAGVVGWFALLLGRTSPELDALERTSWALAISLSLRALAAGALISIVLSIDRLQTAFESAESPVVPAEALSSGSTVQD